MLKRNMVVGSIHCQAMLYGTKTENRFVVDFSKLWSTGSSHNVLQPAVLNTEINSIIRSFVNTKHRVLWIYLRNWLFVPFFHVLGSVLLYTVWII